MIIANVNSVSKILFGVKYAITISVAFVKRKSFTGCVGLMVVGPVRRVSMLSSASDGTSSFVEYSCDRDMACSPRTPYTIVTDGRTLSQPHV